MALAPASDISSDLSGFSASLSAWTEQAIEGLLSPPSIIQLIIIFVIGLFSFIVSRYPASHLKRAIAGRADQESPARLLEAVAIIIWPAVMAVFLWAAVFIVQYGILREGILLRTTASLLTAWVIVRLLTANIQHSYWRTVVGFIIWLLAALHILHLLVPITQSMDAVAFTVGGVELTLLRLVTSIILAFIALWIGRVAGDAAQVRLRSNKRLTPSMAGLLGQVAKIGIMVLAVAIALSTIGINLTTLTVLSGAVGIGIGFGLQAIFSNFISGIIILMEKSIKVGDFIELQSGVTGEVKEINIRSTLVTTNDNVDILVPNEEFIKAQVINWTLKETLRRMRIPFGVAYGTKKEDVLKAGLEAAAEVQWTFDDGKARAPQVWLVGFGDSSLDYELIVWITEEAVKRPARVIADYNWAIHSALERYKLEIPFPQRDLHVRSSEPIPVRIEDKP